MTKKELQAMMAEIKADQTKAKEEAVTKDDIKAMMAEMMKTSKVEEKEDKEDKEVKVEVKVDKEEDKEQNLSQEDIKEFMNDFVKQGEDDKPKPSSVKAQGGGDITMFKETGTTKGFGF